MTDRDEATIRQRILKHAAEVARLNEQDARLDADARHANGAKEFSLRIDSERLEKAHELLFMAQQQKKVWSAEELVARPQQNITWLVEGLLAPGLTLLGGPQKEAGKSVFAMQVAASVALGSPFLGLKTKQTHALYISSDELSPDVLKRQAYPFISGAANIPLDFACGWPAAERGGFEKLEMLLAEQPSIGLIVIDTFQKWLGPRVVGLGYGRDTEIMERLAFGIERLKRPVAFLVVHHVRKGRGPWIESFYGTSGIAAGFLNLWHLAKVPSAPDEGPYAFNAKGRLIRGESLRLMRKLHSFPELDDPNNSREVSHGFEWVLDERARDEATAHPTELAIIRVLQGVPEAVREKDLVSLMREREHCFHSRNHIMKVAERLVDAGVIVRRGSPYRWQYLLAGKASV